MKTEQMLNAPYWKNSNGAGIRPCNMQEDYIRNVLNFIYKKRSWLFFNASPNTMQQYVEPDAFYKQRVCNSVLYQALMQALENKQQGAASKASFIYNEPAEPRCTHEMPDNDVPCDWSF
jgi:hypothetical protein